MTLPSSICVGWYTSSGMVITDIVGSPLKIILIMGIPNVNDLCVAQNMRAGQSTGWNPNGFHVDITNITVNKTHWIITMRRMMDIRFMVSKLRSS